MRYYTHVTTSLAAVSLLPVAGVSLSISLLAGVIVGSVAPDIDEPKSYVGRRTKGISHFVKLLFGHRGFTHTMIPCLLLGVLAFNLNSELLWGFALGYFLHIVGDSFSKSGVPFLWPFTKKHIGVPLYKTGGVLELVIFATSLLYLIYVLM